MVVTKVVVKLHLQEYIQKMSIAIGKRWRGDCLISFIYFFTVDEGLVREEFGHADPEAGALCRGRQAGVSPPATSHCHVLVCGWQGLGRQDRAAGNQHT